MTFITALLRITISRLSLRSTMIIGAAIGCLPFGYNLNAAGIVYVSHTDAGEPALYLHDTGTSSRLPLSSLMESGRSFQNFQIDSKGKSVAYIADEVQNSVFRLTHVSTKTGLNKPVEPAGLSPNADVTNVAFDAKGKNLFYMIEKSSEDIWELYRADVKKNISTRINPAPQAFTNTPDFQPLPKGNGVVALGDFITNGRYQLVLLTQSTIDPVLLSGGANTSGNIGDYKVTPKGTGVVFYGDLEEDDVHELFYTDLKKGTTKRLSLPMPSGGDVSNFIIDPKGKCVVYAADQEIDNKIELFKVDIKTGTVVKISGEMNDSADVFNQGYSFDSKGASVLFLSNLNTFSNLEVVTANLKTGTVQVVSAPLPANMDNSMALFDGKGNIYYIGDQNGISTYDLFKRDVKTAEISRIDDPSLTSVRIFSLAVERNGSGVMYIASDSVSYENDYIFFDSATGTSIPIEQQGESIWEYKMINSNQI